MTPARKAIYKELIRRDQVALVLPRPVYPYDVSKVWPQWRFNPDFQPLFDFTLHEVGVEFDGSFCPFCGRYSKIEVQRSVIHVVKRYFCMCPMRIEIFNVSGELLTEFKSPL